MNTFSPSSAQNLHDLVCNCKSWPHCGALDNIPEGNDSIILAAPKLVDALDALLDCFLEGNSGDFNDREMEAIDAADKALAAASTWNGYLKEPTAA